MFDQELLMYTPILFTVLMSLIVKFQFKNWIHCRSYKNDVENVGDILNSKFINYVLIK